MQTIRDLLSRDLSEPIERGVAQGLDRIASSDVGGYHEYGVGAAGGQLRQRFARIIRPRALQV